MSVADSDDDSRRSKNASASKSASAAKNGHDAAKRGDADPDEEVQVRAKAGGEVVARWSVVDKIGVGGKNDGLFEWECTVPARGTLELETNWGITAAKRSRHPHPVINPPYPIYPRM